MLDNNSPKDFPIYDALGIVIHCKGKLNNNIQNQQQMLCVAIMCFVNKSTFYRWRIIDITDSLQVVI